MKRLLSALTLGWTIMAGVLAIAADKVIVIPLLMTCGDGLAKCSDICVDTQHNPSYCGDCSTVCDAGSYCDQGKCKGLVNSLCNIHTDCLSGKCLENKCGAPSKFVFVSNATFAGNLGGLAGADTQCQALAEAARLPGTYKAWLSSTSVSASSRFSHSDAPYILVDGTLIANNWNDLISGALASPISLDENGTPLLRPVWTGTKYTGEIMEGTQCASWIAGSYLSAQIGITSETNNDWTEAGEEDCELQCSLYCFEQ
ncbi:hypothetical protein [Desulfogranum japonicum]|uniref:hypothetical protein n=1 Tax=Desulfogranum japonicum TaxID=231447 RepID=UPI0003FE4F76|nr:hypothetical protein [Desulfogranum japonicum]